jgi:5-methylcytosine-specific restriction endonuclease McrA
MDTGLTIPPWSGRRRAEALATVKARGRAANTPCCICRQPIDYTLERTEDSCSVQHIRSRKHYPHLTWDPSNWAPAHLGCNKSAGADNGIAGLGLLPV